MEGDIYLYDNDDVMKLTSYLFIGSIDKKKLHLCLRRVYYYDLPAHLQSFRKTNKTCGQQHLLDIKDCLGLVTAAS
eukprot:870594-Ditylum_brightwellii.AAC.1